MLYHQRPWVQQCRVPQGADVTSQVASMAADVRLRREEGGCGLVKATRASGHRGQGWWWCSQQRAACPRAQARRRFLVLVWWPHPGSDQGTLELVHSALSSPQSCPRVAAGQAGLARGMGGCANGPCLGGHLTLPRLLAHLGGQLPRLTRDVQFRRYLPESSAESRTSLYLQREHYGLTVMSRPHSRSIEVCTISSPHDYCAPACRNHCRISATAQRLGFLHQTERHEPLHHLKPYRHVLFDHALKKRYVIRESIYVEYC